MSKKRNHQNTKMSKKRKQHMYFGIIYLKKGV